MRLLALVPLLLLFIWTLQPPKPIIGPAAAAQQPDTSYAVTMVKWDTHLYVAHRDTVKFNDISAFFQEYLPAIYTRIQTAGVPMTGAPSGLYWWWNEQEADMAAAIPVAEAGDFAPFVVVPVTAAEALTVDYFGPYEGLEGAHQAVEKYMEAHDYDPAQLVIEEYLTDPTTQPDTSKWLTKVYYVLGEADGE